MMRVTSSESRAGNERNDALLPEAGHPWVGRAVLGLAALAGIFLAVGLFLTLSGVDVHTPITRAGLKAPLTLAMRGDPSGLFAVGALLLLSLPLARDAAIVVIAMKERALSRALLAAIGGLALVGLYAALYFLTSP